VIDSREFLMARRRAEAAVLLPAGPKIAFTGGLDFNDHHAIWARLDEVRDRHPDMVLPSCRRRRTTGSPAAPTHDRGHECTQALW
jgi:hypothetical protein